MKNLSASYLKVDYNLRPAKQIERRMILDTFHNLGTVGFPIRDYKYVGFGSIYFVDFAMFHKLLGIRKLLSRSSPPTVEPDASSSTVSTLPVGCGWQTVGSSTPRSVV